MRPLLIGEILLDRLKKTYKIKNVRLIAYFVNKIHKVKKNLIFATQKWLVA